MGIVASQAIHVPHELPGQDPEGGSEVNFGDEPLSDATATPRADSDLSRRASESGSYFQDGRPSLEGRSASGGLAASAAAGAFAAGGGPAPPGTPSLGGAFPETQLGGVPVPNGGVERGGVPPAAAAGDADGLGGSWQDLQVLRAQSMAHRSSAIHYTHVSCTTRESLWGCFRGVTGS